MNILFIVEQFINTLKHQLLEPLPGQDAQYLMSPALRARFDLKKLVTGNYRPSAVMILFCQDAQQEWFIPLTLRSSYQGAHSGQVSLPGGKPEPSDQNLQGTAIRECYEEIGIRDQLEILGSLTKLYIPVSGFLVEPFVGVCQIQDPVFVPQEREVKSILRLKVKDLMSDTIVQHGTITLEGNEGLNIEAPYFSEGEHKIWGATAMILSELKAVLSPIF